MKFCFLARPKLKKVEGRVGELEKKVRELACKCDLVLEKAGRTPAIDFVYVENLHVDRLEFANNFGALGIRELGGALNVGVNCWGGAFPGKDGENEERNKEKKGEKKEERRGGRPGEKKPGGPPAPGGKGASPGERAGRENRSGPACSIRFGAPGEKKAGGG